MSRDFFKLCYTQPRMSAGDTAEIMLYGEIIQDIDERYKWSKEDKSAADFDKAMKQVLESGAKKLNLRINSPGGVVTEAVAMRGILAAAEFEEIHIRIEGLCASAATIIATLPGADVEITEGSEYMIHNPWTIDWGNADQLEQTVQHLRSEESTVRALYAKKTGQTDEQIKEWMDAETWFTAQDAVKYGFCDKVMKEPEGEKGKVAACVTPRTMSAMKAMYAHVPESIAEVAQEPPKDISTTEPAIAAGEVTENKISEEEEEMEIKDLTIEQLREGNAALYDSVMRAGEMQERQRLQDIEDLTPAGYENMAKEAKENGTSAMDYHKAIVKAQREKAAQFLSKRAEEVAPANAVIGGASIDGGKSAEQEMKDFASEMAEYAKSVRAGADGMY